VEVIPAVDLRRGKLVRLRQGEDQSRLEYPWAPEAWFERLVEAGFRRVHLVDLDAAFGEPPQWDRIARWPEKFPALRFQLGGGARCREALARAFGYGFDRVVVGSWLARDPEGFLDAAGEYPGRVVPALDCRSGALVIDGWRRVSERPLESLCRLLRGSPCPGVLVTGIERDGTLAGPDLALAEKIACWTAVPVWVSGGVSSTQDLDQAAAVPGVFGVVVGKALLEGYLDLAQTAQRFPVRMGRPWGKAAGKLPSGLTVRLIPCLDVAGGRVVKGVQFQALRDAGDPVELAQLYAAEGADEVAFLDIQAASEARGPMVAWVERVAEKVFVPLTVGGGVRCREDAASLLASGADKVVVNTHAVQNPRILEQLAGQFGSQCVVVAIDARRVGEDQGWEVVTHGGRVGTGKDVVSWAKEAVQRGAGEILLTSMDRDGTKAGYDLELVRTVADLVSVPVIASGGASGLEDFVEAFQAGAAGVLAASVFHYGELKVSEVREALRELGFPVRSQFKELAS
jgi:cyclase